MCVEISERLKEQGVRILSFATDGDRGNVDWQRDLFVTYEARLDDPNLSIERLCQDRLEPRDIPWWIADPLHALKCQRTRLKNRLFLRPSGYVDAGVMNETLQLNVAVSNFDGLAKMNDVLAVEVFAMDNVAKLVRDGKVMEAYHLLPFASWYTAIALQGLSWDTRLSLLTIAFYTFVESYQQSRSLLKEFLVFPKVFR
jgi:hypothetical protein